MIDTPSASMRGLALRLLDLEASHPPASHEHRYEAVRVCDKLCLALTRFAGADGSASLLRRSLALARREAPSLNSITVKPDCSMDGLEALAAEEADGGVRAAIALAAHLLGLLVTFIGEPLTLRLVRERWPGASLDVAQTVRRLLGHPLRMERAESSGAYFARCVERFLETLAEAQSLAVDGDIGDRLTDALHLASDLLDIITEAAGLDELAYEDMRDQLAALRCVRAPSPTLH